MPSTDKPPQGVTPHWRLRGERYYRIGTFFERLFGCRAWKVSVDAGLDCPNRDGTLGTGGCRFCNPASFSPSRRRGSGASIGEQIRRGAERLSRRHGAERFLAYFQPGTNTHGPGDTIRALYEEALACPGVVGLVVGTRPDCLGDESLDILGAMSRRTWVSVELGVQTIHDRSLDWLGRGHRHEATVDAIRRVKGRGLHVGAHVILGLPGETVEDMRATADELARLKIDSVKLHNLYVAPGTRLAEDYTAGQLRLPSREEYVECVVEFLERLPADCAIDRLSSDAPAEYLLAPEWCRDKAAVRRMIEEEMARRDTYQGMKRAG